MLFTVLLGILLGILYAVSFVTQQRRLFRVSTKKYPTIPVLIIIRIMLIGIFSYYLLHLPSTRHILIATIAFIAGFWLVILSKRALSHERN
jgi:hypothetical protein